MILLVRVLQRKRVETEDFPVKTRLDTETGDEIDTCTCPFKGSTPD